MLSCVLQKVIRVAGNQIARSTSANATWYDRRMSSGDAIYGMKLDLTASASMAVSFMDGMYRGEEDKVIGEMLVNCRAMTAVQKLDYSNLNGGGFKQRLVDQFKLDTQPPPAVCDGGDDILPAPREDQELLERERALQEQCAIKHVQRNKDVYHTHDMT